MIRAPSRTSRVPQRMAIISAGVIMNVILGCACFMFVYMAHGMEQPPAEIGQVDNGSPAWKKGMQSGMEIYKIGDATDPYFENLMAQVVLSRNGQELDLSYGFPKEKRIDTTIDPRRTKAVVAASSASGRRNRCGSGRSDSGERAVPALVQSPAAKAGFEFGDEIIGCTDPDKEGHPVTELPEDPANPKQLSYFAFRKRLQLLAGKEMIVRVKRGDGTKDLTLGPAYVHTFGLRMKMGKITSLRDTCPARSAGAKVNDQITRVEVEDSTGKKLRWAWAADEKPKEPDEQVLDPMRLPFELQRWADEKRAANKSKWETDAKYRGVKLTVRRTTGHNPKDEPPLDMPWDDTYRFDNEAPLNNMSPMAIPCLGLAYGVETTVEAWDPEGAAAKAKTEDGKVFTWQKGDVIKAYCEWMPGKKPDEKPHPAEKRTLKTLFVQPDKIWTELKPEAWPKFFMIFQDHADIKELDLRVEAAGNNTTERFEIHIIPELANQPGKEWPLIDRGIGLRDERRMQKAKDLGEALAMGFNKSLSYIGQIYGQLRSLVMSDLSMDNVGGPMQIFNVAYNAADNDIFTLIYFLGVISVNLAVVNFLPIPVLDGGHMVFLIYEGLRGKPASEQVRIAATYVGLLLIGSLMLFVIFMDVRKYFL